MKKYKYLSVIMVLLHINIIAQNDNGKQNCWQIGFTFGEIPILSGSFKPGITFGYHFNQYLTAEFTYQLKDYLQRDEESFNAVNIGFDGLISSKETTGERIFLGLRYKPTDWSPYLTAGFVVNMDDIETINYDNRERFIGDNIYNGNIEIVQKRETGVAPAVGLGYQYDFENGISLNTSFGMAFFNQIPTAKVNIKTESNILGSDLNKLYNKIDDEYKSNFHNRYHIFNIGIAYKFK